MASFVRFLSGTGFFVARIYGFSFSSGSIVVDNKINLKQNASITNVSDTSELEKVSEKAVSNSSSDVQNVTKISVSDPVTISYTLKLPRESWNVNFTVKTSDNYKVLTSKVQGFVDDALKKKFGDNIIVTKDYNYT